MQAIIYKGQKVITTELLAQAYETTTDRIKQNFNRNKDRFAEGKHHFLLTGEELRTFKREVSFSDLAIPVNVNQLYLWTERGANRHSKILDTDKAWEQFENLEETYFRVKSRTNELASAPPSVSPGGLASLINVTRRSMIDMGCTATEIGEMVQSIYCAWSVPLPNNFVKHSPKQTCLYGSEWSSTENSLLQQ